ncbi:MAG: phosphate/phosphite/phosphonate ABC transporter substrate-binding protein, partial [Myxococcales bacterium]|nr:phosphate/phosphite/phosphonate ABC transporter substrate-binding protein [Myxococcales bacterium]
AIKIGVTPYLPRAVLQRSIAPLLAYLERRVHRRFELVVSDSYTQMMDALVKGQVDVADLTAYPFLLTQQRDPKIQPLATAVTESSKTYESYLVVPRESKAERIGDVRGKRICYVDSTSTSGYLMPRVMVRAAGFDPDRFFGSVQFSGNHYRALRDLLAARCDVAAVTSGAYVSARRQHIPIANVRILKISQPIPHGVFCAGSHVPRAVARRIRAALLGFDVQRELGRKVLSDTLRFSGFDKPDAKAFASLAAEMARTRR